MAGLSAELGRGTRRILATIALSMLGVFLVVLVTLTIRQRDYIEELDWSAVHRTPLQWPSLLATGSGGWLLCATFLLSGLSVIGLAAAYRAMPGVARGTATSIGLTVMGIGLCLIAFPADRPDVASASWHANIHNGSYPLIPLGGMVACALAASEPTGSRLRAWSRLLLPALIVSFAGGELDDIAQLSRYFAFGFLLAWTAVVAVAVRTDVRSTV